MSLLIYCLSKSTLSGPISSLCEKIILGISNECFRGQVYPLPNLRVLLEKSRVNHVLTSGTGNLTVYHHKILMASDDDPEEKVLEEFGRQGFQNVFLLYLFLGYTAGRKCKRSNFSLA
jgi:hypothetical protein